MNKQHWTNISKQIMPSEELIQDTIYKATQIKPRKTTWKIASISAACFTLIGLTGTVFFIHPSPLHTNTNGGSTVAHNTTLPKNSTNIQLTHTVDSKARASIDDFVKSASSSDIPKYSIDEIKKVYDVSIDNWYLNKNVTSFKEVICTNYKYIVPSTNQKQYDTFTVTDKDTLSWSGSCTPANAKHTFATLTYQSIQETVETAKGSNDYFISYSNLLSCIFISGQTKYGKEYIVPICSSTNSTGLVSGNIYDFSNLSECLTKNLEPK